MKAVSVAGPMLIAAVWGRHAWYYADLNSVRDEITRNAALHIVKEWKTRISL